MKKHYFLMSLKVFVNYKKSINKNLIQKNFYNYVLIIKLS